MSVFSGAIVPKHSSDGCDPANTGRDQGPALLNKTCSLLYVTKDSLQGRGDTLDIIVVWEKGWLVYFWEVGA